jgi:hypothetical protein
MSYSCAARASDIERVWADVCYKQTGSSNVYEVDGKRYFYNVGREQRDGAVTGSVWRMEVALRDSKGSHVGSDGVCVRAGTFRIEPDGTVTRFPVGFRKVIGKK